MKKIAFVLVALAMLNLTFVSCEKTKTDNPPELPPLESMVYNFSDFQIAENEAQMVTDNFKTAGEGTRWNYAYAWLNVAYFNVLLTGALAVPVTAFGNSFRHQAEFMGEATWQWSYTVDGFGGSYTARLVGTVRAEDVKWEMYLAHSGIINPHPEFLWFEGTSDLDGMGGEWMLYHSYAFQEPLLSIDWQKSGAEIGEIKYTYVREQNDAREDEAGTGGYIHAGRTGSDLNAFYAIHVYDTNEQMFIDVNIEWNTENYNGRVSSDIYQGGVWQCWDGMGYDTVCPE
jgi:hypothetical protein